MEKFASYFQFRDLSALKITYLQSFRRVLEQHSVTFSSAHGDWRGGGTPQFADEKVEAPRGEVTCVQAQKT